MEDWKNRTYEEKCAEVERYENLTKNISGRERAAWTVGELRKLIEGEPDDMTVLVSHQPLYQHIGHLEPMIHVGKLYREVFDAGMPHPFCDGTYRKALIIE